MSIRCMGCLLAVLVFALAPTTAHANCFSRLPSSVEVLPEDGAVAPADIAYLFVEDYAFGFNLTVESDGKRYPVVDSLAKLPEDLKPGDVFEYMIIAEIKPEHASGSSPGGKSSIGPFSFTVGETNAGPVTAPTGSLRFVEGTLCGQRTPSSPSCEPDERLRHVVDDCYDTGVVWYWVLDVDTDADAQFFEITGDGFSSFYSRGCDRFDGVPAVGGAGDSMGPCERANCVEVIPYDAAMRPHPDKAAILCDGDKPVGDAGRANEGDAGRANAGDAGRASAGDAGGASKSDAGRANEVDVGGANEGGGGDCAVSQGAERSTTAWRSGMLALGVALLLRRMRRKG